MDYSRLRTASASSMRGEPCSCIILKIPCALDGAWFVAQAPCTRQEKMAGSSRKDVLFDFLICNVFFCEFTSLSGMSQMFS